MCVARHLLLGSLLNRRFVLAAGSVAALVSFISVNAVTKGKHEIVPKEIREEAEKYAKESLEEEEDSDDDNM